jgi:hypothetical protein
MRKASFSIALLPLRTSLENTQGRALQNAVLEVLDELAFVSKLGSFTMDNAPNNDTMMRALPRGDFYGLLITIYAFIEFAKLWRLKYDANTHRLRCQAILLTLLSNHSFL